MSAKGPASFPRASRMFISSGNIINYNNMRKDIPRTSTDELKLAISSALTETPRLSNGSDGSATSQAVQFFTPGQRIECSGCDNMELMKITLKVMLSNTDPGILTQAINMSMEELHVTKIDSVLLAMPARPFGEELNIDHYRPVWLEMEELVKGDKVKTLGVCDLDVTMLKELHSWARVRPTSNQMNQASCCVIPPELKAFANENMLQLVSHSDQADIMPPQLFQEVILANFPEHLDSASWNPSWIVRYTALIKNRGIVTTKGYILRAEREVPLY